MTVLPFTTRESDDRRVVDRPTAPDVVGHFAPPAGSHGRFSGSFRLERLVDQFGQTAAAGVFTGELVGADGDRIGLASRRHVAAAEVVDDPHGRYVELGPVDVNLLGFTVAMDAFTVTVPLDLPATTSPGGHLRSAAELLGLVVDTTARPQAHGRRDDRDR